MCGVKGERQGIFAKRDFEFGTEWLSTKWSVEKFASKFPASNREAVPAGIRHKYD
jgi:hypothetical protein